jgi:hypothetical protein
MDWDGTQVALTFPLHPSLQVAFNEVLKPYWEKV